MDPRGGGGRRLTQYRPAGPRPGQAASRLQVVRRGGRGRRAVVRRDGGGVAGTVDVQPAAVCVCVCVCAHVRVCMARICIGPLPSAAKVAGIVS